MPPATEAARAAETPPKAMKQARLPFAPINKATDKGLSASGKKRKLEDQTTESKKAPKLDIEETPPAPAEPLVDDPSSIKLKLAAFRSDQEHSEKVEEEVSKENETPVTKGETAAEKPKECKSKSKTENLPKEKPDQDGKTSKFSGLLRLPFKKKDKKGVDKKASDDSIDLGDDCAVLEMEEVQSSADSADVADADCMEDTGEEKSMTEEWASFHEENPGAVEPAKAKKPAAAKPKAKGGKGEKKAKPSAVQGKDVDSEEPSAVSAPDVEKKPATPQPKMPDVEKKPSAKEGLLSKFFSKSKTKLPSEVPAADADIEIISMKKVDTPLRTSPRKKAYPRIDSPFEPTKVKSLAVAKLRVRLTELKMELEEAVTAADFLKAHEKKQAILKVEEEMKEVEAKGPDVFKVTGGGDATAARLAADSGCSPATPRPAGSVLASGAAASPTVPRKMTPGQMRKKEEASKKREAVEEEKKAKKEEVAKKKEEERLEKERKKEVEKRVKDVEKMETDRKKKAKELEKEKEKKQKEEEREKKKTEKDLEVKAKEEEKKVIEEAEKEKLMKKAQAFKSFFKKSDHQKKEMVDSEVSFHEEAAGMFTIFQMKKNMRIAPTVRGNPELARSRLDALDMPCGPEGLYVQQLRRGHTPASQARTWPYLAKDEDVTIVEDEDDEEGGEVAVEQGRGGEKAPRAKLLQFHANQRPAYWGTWTKRSKLISGRRPLGRDEQRFDYDYDSDDDWEEEEEGEDLGDDDKDKEESAKEGGEEDYEVDNDFFVPHGYLSDEEEDKDEDEKMFDPEAAKEKLKLREQEFEAEHKKKTHMLKPRLWGVCWEDEPLDTDAAAGQLVKVLARYAGIVEGHGNNNWPIDTGFTKDVSSPGLEEAEGDCDTSVTSASGRRGRKSLPFPDDALPELVRLVHANPNNKMFLAREFLEFWRRRSGAAEGAGGEEPGTPGSAALGSISKRAMIGKILEIAEWNRSGGEKGRLWFVKKEILAKLEMTPPNPNEWSYILEQTNKKHEQDEEKKADKADPKSSRPVSPVAPPAPASLITMFARVLSKEERQEQRVKQEAARKAEQLRKEEAKAEQLAKAEHAKRQEAKKQALAKVAAKQQAKPKGASVKPKPKPSLGLASLPGIKVTPIEGKAAPGPKASPVITVRKDLQAGSPAVKRGAGPAASPIAVKRAPKNVLGFQASSPVGKGAGVAPVFASPIQVKRGSSSTKPSVVQKVVGQVQVDCITIDDSN